MGTPAYDRENTRRINLKLNNRTDADIIQRLESQESIQGYIKSLIRADIEKEAPKMISLDNGNTFLTASEAIAAMHKQADEYGTSFGKLWNVIAALMDDEIRETVNSELAPCTEEEFLARYLELAPENLIIG